MPNTGKWPIDEASAVGAFRIEIGDSVPVGAPIDGDNTTTFEFFSDAYLLAQLDKFPDDPDEAMARGLDTMARRLIIEAEDIQVDDIKIKTIERAKLFSEHANAIRIYGAARGGEGFIVTALHTTTRHGYDYPPQGTPDPYPQVG